MKIGQYLAKIWTEYDSLLFFGPPCMLDYNFFYLGISICGEVMQYKCDHPACISADGHLEQMM